MIVWVANEVVPKVVFLVRSKPFPAEYLSGRRAVVNAIGSQTFVLEN